MPNPLIGQQPKEAFAFWLASESLEMNYLTEIYMPLMCY